METKTMALSNGNAFEMKIVNGTAYHVETPQRVVDWLESARERNMRIRVFYGDTKTGRDWMEENDTIGYVGRSTGEFKVPLLLQSNRSSGGGSILDNRIVRLLVKMGSLYDEVYRHPGYHQADMKLVDIAKGNLTVGVWRSDHPEFPYCAGFKTRPQAIRWRDFMKEERQSK